MKLPQIITDNPVKITKFVPGGQGLGTTKEGIKGFFWNALPGETVIEYEITKKKSHYFEAIALKIERPSSHRIPPKDTCYLSTSPWQIMDYDYELAKKAELLVEIFRQHFIGTENAFSRALSEPVSRKVFTSSAFAKGSDADLTKNLTRNGRKRNSPLKAFSAPMTNAQDFFYRNKMEYSLYFDHETEKLHLGFHKRGTHRKIKVETSSLERPEIFKKAREIVDELNKNHKDGRNYQSLLLRASQNGEVEGGLYENRKPHPVFKNLTDTILGKTYSYSPNGFFQINLPVYEMALNEIKQHIKTENVLDLYAGVGTIGLSVAADRNLTLVEVDKNAFRELEKNCCISKIRPVLAKSEEVTDLIAADQTVIVDPPRAGLDKKLVEKLLEIMPETIIYLSCNPVTQARDLGALTTKYHIIKIAPFNFFPRTPHLENLVVLARK